VDFNGLTGVADVSLCTIELEMRFSTWMLVVYFNGLKVRGGRLFIDSGATCGFLQTQQPCWTYLCTHPDVGCGF